jgi:hypothetical protein
MDWQSRIDLLINLLIAIGPLFAISRIIGDKRALLLESWLLRFQKIALRQGKLFFNFGVFLIYIWIVVIVTGIVLKLSYVLLGRIFEKIPDLYAFLIMSVCGFGLFWAVPIYINFVLIVKILEWVYSVGQKNANQWRIASESDPPLPLRWISGREFNFRRCFWFTQSLFLIIPIYSFIIPLLWTMVFVVLLPFKGADILRQKLTPERPYYLDILAYLISVLGMLYKFIAL